jgi:cytochrome b
MSHNALDAEPDISDTHQGRSRVFVWDIPVRLFHWTLVALMVALVITANIPIDVIGLHAKLGFAALALVLFRLLWGFIGSSYARFSQFVHGPGTVIAYARSLLAKQDGFVAGHNPLGGWMVVVLLLAVMLQVTLGMFSNDDVFFEGPLAYLVSKDTSDLITSLHGDMFNVLLALVILHVSAVIWHILFRGENLIFAMFTGHKELPPGIEAKDASGGGIWFALVSLAVSVAVVVWLAV